MTEDFVAHFKLAFFFSLFLSVSLSLAIMSSIRPSHEARHLAAAAQLGRPDLDALRLAHPRVRLDEPLVPDLAIVRLPPHADLELRVGGVVQRLLCVPCQLESGAKEKQETQKEEGVTIQNEPVMKRRETRERGQK